MKEEEFNKTLEEFNFAEGIVIKVYYAVDEHGEVIIDEQGIRRELDNKLNEIQEFTE